HVWLASVLAPLLAFWLAWSTSSLDDARAWWNYDDSSRGRQGSGQSRLPGAHGSCSALAACSRRVVAKRARTERAASRVPVVATAVRHHPERRVREQSADARGSVERDADHGERRHQTHLPSRRPAAPHSAVPLCAALCHSVPLCATL